jgi:hypothetical protein
VRGVIDKVEIIRLGDRAPDRIVVYVFDAPAQELRRSDERLAGPTVGERTSETALSRCADVAVPCAAASSLTSRRIEPS